MYNSTKARIEAIKKMTAKHYEEGNLSKCRKNVWRRFIFPNFGICYATYLKYLKTE